VSLLEAMACEVPVVATHPCNFPDISSAQAGWECDAALDPLTETLQRAFLAAESELKQRGQNGRRLVESRYTWPSILSSLLQACAAYY
jgi:glycosyltransferase involved in cell wall biosynthesis